MTDSDAEAADNPLLVPLTAEQERLLDLIWSGIPDAGMVNEPPHWPIWDYVEASLYSYFPELEDASAVLHSLPRLTIFDGYPPDAYGLVWSGQNTINLGHTPLPDEVMGLTIAGIVRVEHKRGYPRESLYLVSDLLAQVIAAVADEATKVQPQPRAVVRGNVPLAMLTEHLVRAPRRERSFAFSDELTRELLVHEPVHINVNAGNIVPDPRQLRPFRAVSNAEEYLRVVSARAERARRPARTPSSLSLIQTLDYLTLVVADTKPWEHDRRFVEAPDLQSAAALGSQVSTQDDFVTRMLGVYSVVERFGVPEIPHDATVPEHVRNGILNRLQYWLMTYLDEDAHGRVIEAIKDIRAVISLRHLGAHANQRTRQDSVRNLERIGLPPIVADWASAWSTVTSVLASAFDVIRLEVQSRARANQTD